MIMNKEIFKINKKKKEFTQINKALWEQIV